MRENIPVVPTQAGCAAFHRALVLALITALTLVGCQAVESGTTHEYATKKAKVAYAHERPYQKEAAPPAGYAAGGAESERLPEVAKPNLDHADEPAAGFYKLGDAIDFNVLDAAYFNPANGQVSLIGHRDARYGTRPIPYLEHLAALLEHPEPEFTLNWTPDSQARVARLFRLFNSESYVRSLVASWTNIMDENGHPTGSGRWLLPVIGIKPTYHGSRLGRLGASFVETETSVRIVSVQPGSAADRVGIEVGDLIHNFENAAAFARAIEQTGEGGQLMLQVRHNGRVGSPLYVTLDGADGDPWAALDRFDVVQRMMGAAGKDKAAMLLNSYANLQRIMRGSKTGFMTAFNILIAVAGDNDAYWQDVAEYNAGRMAQDVVLGHAFRAILVAMDDAFEFSDRPLTSRFDAARSNGMDSGSAFDEAVPVMNARIGPYLEEVMKSLLARNDEIQIPADVMASALGPQVFVAPEYRDLDPNSSLARLMFAADYIGKSLINEPDLQKKIPAYQTDFAFERNHPDRVGTWHESADYHLWLSIAGLDLAESVDGRTLHTRGATIRFNIREKAPEGGDLAPVGGGYEELLTSLYGDFCREYPELHEFSEAAKLVGVARWLGEKDPALRLPATGRSRWTGPTTVPGFVFLTFSPQNRPGRLAAALSAMGGNKLGVKKDAAKPRRESKTTTFDSTTLVLAPWREDPTAVAAALRAPADALPKPLGWASGGSVDGQHVTAVSFVPRDLHDAPTDVQAQQRTADDAFVLWKAGDIEGAVQSLKAQIAKATAPAEIARLQLTLADVLRKSGQEPQAIQLLKEAVQLDPKNPVLHLLIAEAAAETGDRAGAVAELKTYLALDPQNAPAARLLAELEGRTPPTTAELPAQSSSVAATEPGTPVAPVAAVTPAADARGGLHLGPALQQAMSAAIDATSGSASQSEAAKGGVGLGFDRGQQHAPEVPAFTSHPLTRPQPPEKLRATDSWKALESRRDNLAQQQADVEHQLDKIHEEQTRPGANPAALAQKEKDLLEQQKVVKADAEKVEKQMRDDIIKWEAEEEPAKATEGTNAAGSSEAKPDTNTQKDKP